MTPPRGPGRVRIIGGSLRNSRLDVPEVPGLRPTSERVRETLFNWLAPSLPGATVLDLFAGTGALGIEALSRGATAVRFVERDPAAARALRDNLARLKQTSGQISTQDALSYLDGAATAHDLVLLDPPFAQNLWSGAAERLERRGWLRPTAWIYIETPHGTALDLPPSWRVHRAARAGEVAYALYRREADLG